MATTEDSFGEFSKKGWPFLLAFLIVGLIPSIICLPALIFSLTQAKMALIVPCSLALARSDHMGWLKLRFSPFRTQSHGTGYQ